MRAKKERPKRRSSLGKPGGKKAKTEVRSTSKLISRDNLHNSRVEATKPKML
jgi:hypothetical protein